MPEVGLDLSDHPGSTPDTAVSAFSDIASFVWPVGPGAAVMSDAALSLFGVRTAMDFEGFLDLVHPDDRLRVEGEITSLIENGGSACHEYRICRPDGEVRHLLVHSTHRLDGPAPRVEGLMFDVTLTRMRDQVSDFTRQDSRVFGFYDYDVARQKTVWSPNLQKLLSAKDGPILSAEQVRRYIHADDRDRVAGWMTVAMKTPGPYEFEFRVTLTDGTVRWVRDRGEAHAPVDPELGMVRRVTGTLTDITDEVDATSSAQDGLDTFWTALDNAPILAYVVDGDLRITRMTKAARPVFAGIDPLEGRGLSEVLHILWPASFATEAVARFREVLETGKSYIAPTVVEQRSDLRRLEAYDWRVEPLHLPDGRMAAICYFYDLSERVRQEYALRENERRLNLAYEAADMGAWEVDLLNQRTHWTPQLFRMFGADPEEENPDDIWRAMVDPDDQAVIDAAFTEAMESGGKLEEEVRITLESGETRHIVTRGELVTTPEGQPDRMIGVNFDITSRKEAELAAAQSEERLRLVIDNTVAFIGVLEPDGTLREANRTALDAAAIRREDVIGLKFWEAYWWSQDSAAAEKLKAAVAEAASGKLVRYDAVIRVAGGQPMTVDFMISPVHDDRGKTLMLVVSGFDISEREEARRHIHSLLGEINHRTKNLLTLIQIIARQTARSGPDGFIDRFEKRVRALSAAQDLLVKNDADTVDLADLARTQLAHFDGLIGRRVHLDGPPVTLPSHAAQAIGMAIHELSTNAAKYGALSNDTGEIHIGWHLAPDEAGVRHFHMRWKESGGPRVTPPERHGFGTTLIDHMIGSALDGEVRLEFPEDGLEWQVDCPFQAG